MKLHLRISKLKKSMVIPISKEEFFKKVDKLYSYYVEHKFEEDETPENKKKEIKKSPPKKFMMTKEEFSKLPLEEQKAFIDKLAKQNPALKGWTSMAWNKQQGLMDLGWSSPRNLETGNYKPSKFVRVMCPDGRWRLIDLEEKK